MTFRPDLVLRRYRRSEADRVKTSLDVELDSLTVSPIAILNRLIVLARDHITEQLSTGGIAVFWQPLHEPMLIERWFHDLVVSRQLFGVPAVVTERLVLGEHLEKLTESVRRHTCVIHDADGGRRAYLDQLSMELRGIGTDEVFTRVRFQALRRGGSVPLP